LQVLKRPLQPEFVVEGLASHASEVCQKEEQGD
jgi:hypothetical protein